MMDSTAAKIGRSMKKRVNMRLQMRVRGQRTRSADRIRTERRSRRRNQAGESSGLVLLRLFLRILVSAMPSHLPRMTTSGSAVASSARTAPAAAASRTAVAIGRTNFSFSTYNPAALAATTHGCENGGRLRDSVHEDEEHRRQEDAEHGHAEHPAEHRDAERLPHLRPGPAGDRQRQHAEHERDRGHHDRPEAQLARVEDRGAQVGRPCRARPSRTRRSGSRSCTPGRSAPRTRPA